MCVSECRAPSSGKELNCSRFHPGKQVEGGGPSTTSTFLLGTSVWHKSGKELSQDEGLQGSKTGQTGRTPPSLASAWVWEGSGLGESASSRDFPGPPLPWRGGRSLTWLVFVTLTQPESFGSRDSQLRKNKNKNARIMLDRGHVFILLDD